MQKTVNIRNCSLVLIDPYIGPLSGAISPGHYGGGSNVIKAIIYIPESSSITEISPSDCLVSYTGHSLGGGYSSVEKKSMYSAPTDCASLDLVWFLCLSTDVGYLMSKPFS